MSLPPLRRILSSAVAVGVAGLTAAGCGGQGVTVAKSDPLHRGAEIFNQRCGGCHTLKAGGTEGSATSVGSREYKDGPNFNQRVENYRDVLYAIENGGFSSGPMPQNIVTGTDAEYVACFVSTYSGKQRQRAPSPDKNANAGPDTQDCETRLTSK